eukprot:TRINITY_DN11451_c1_g1_i1.p1 TRINITY_DN11451_c1_g1~~TRINITY_DN11451_c1_g1_i1.p1  ORF type:complete len:1910 (-),score=325.40 TRINITY_DN11451_c1_g1_i1:23-5515(-)
MKVASQYAACAPCGPTPSMCSVPATLQSEGLLTLQRRNCEDKVRKAIEQFNSNQTRWDLYQQEAIWHEKAKRAELLCDHSQKFVERDDLAVAAYLAVNAWSQVIMEDRQCCTLLHPPFCLDTQPSLSTMAVNVLFGILLVMFFGSLLASCTVSKVQNAEVRDVTCEPTQGSQPPKEKLLSRHALQQELAQYWLAKHSLRGLNGAKEFAESSASLFAALYEHFDFQGDSVRNQFEHLLSLWRSHCSLIADKDPSLEELQRGSVAVDESTLLYDALGSLHAQLLEGFTRWREALAAELEDMISIEGHGLAGARWLHVPAGDWLEVEDAQASLVATKQLAEIATYLLVWGEAGNLRFMPEVVYFLTELCLSAEAPEESCSPYGVVACESQCFRSSKFLAFIVRPLYNVIFDEWYDCVDFARVSDQEKRDGVIHDFREKMPTFHRGYEAYLPSDVANYDDWNEFFVDVRRLRLGLPELFAKTHSERFAALRELDWSKLLDSRRTKTHREVHSLWGVFASTHRIWLVHGLLFFTAVCIISGNPETSSDKGVMLLAGSSAPVRFSALGLLAPWHALLMGIARAYTCGSATRRSIRGVGCCCAYVLRILLWSAPLFTYACVRYTYWKSYDSRSRGICLAVHSFVSCWAMASHLFFPARGCDAVYASKGGVKLHLRAVRYLFWFVVLALKFLVALVMFWSIYGLIADLRLVTLGHESSEDIKVAWYSSVWGRDVLVWLWLWFTTLFLFCADTQLWFCIGCTVLGVIAVLVQRRFNCGTFAFEDAVHKLPRRFVTKVLSYAPDRKRAFAETWNCIVHHMNAEQKISYRDSGLLCYDDSARGIPEPPVLFNKENCLERVSKHYCGIEDTREWPTNGELQWRFLALARGLGLEDIPRPYRVPYIPGLTILIPHFNESIVMLKEELYSEAPDEGVRDLGHLIDYLRIRYADEFKNLTNGWAVPGGSTKYSRYDVQQWEETCIWASMRMQTLWRTVAGMTLYHDALQMHYKLQGAISSKLRWNRDDSNDCFRCLVSMQLYTYATRAVREHVNQMLERFPSNLKIAFIDHADRGDNWKDDGIHARQRRRYFSCLCDKFSKQLPAPGPSGPCRWSFRQPDYRIELPGYPILSDGKADNQNHAMPFSRGTICQCIDANQGGYFEQMMMLPCALGEFRMKPKQIVGLPEHITSDIGSIGDFAAGSEMAFGTILQRSYAVLGGRMHYGHPDLMNKQYMMQQGSVSKGTRTLNLSEDIFAGLDFTLRGDGRSISHREYFHLAKGRDLGFNSVLRFFSKLSSGSGEQILTRQFFRLGQVLPLPECFTLYYAHVGYYITQFLLSWATPMVVFTWMVVLAMNCEESFLAFESVCPTEGAAASQLMGRTLSNIYTHMLLVLVLLAAALPLLAEEWMQRSFKVAMTRLLKQVLTLSFLMFVFQAKIIGFYVMNELRYGGAKYISTGRSLPTERRHFLRLKPGKQVEYDGLYLDYAVQTFYDGILLLGASLMVLQLGGMNVENTYRHSLTPIWVCIGLTIISWLYAPFIFNPHQFARRQLSQDRRSLWNFFFHHSGSGWLKWYKEFQLMPRGGLSVAVLDFQFLLVFIGVAVWFAVVNHKVSWLPVVFSEVPYIEQVAALTLTPPVIFGLCFCMLAYVLANFVYCLRRACKFDDESAWNVLQCILPCAAIIVVALQVAESLLFLEVVRETGRMNDYVAGLILKYLFLEVALFLAEGILRSRCARNSLCCGPEGCLQGIYLWVLANRMFRDMVTSVVIIAPLLLLGLLNSVSRMLCNSFDCHECLIYRSSGHRARRRRADDDTDCDDGFSDGLSIDEVSSGDASSSDEEHPLHVIC